MMVLTSKKTKISSLSAAHFLTPQAKPIIERRLTLIAAHLQRMASRYYRGEDFIFENDPLDSAKLQAAFVNDLAALWDIAAGCDPEANQIDHTALEYELWRKVLKDRKPNFDIHPTEQDREKINDLMIRHRTAIFGPLIFAAAERLKGHALEIVWNEEFWTRLSMVEPLPDGQKLLHRINADWLYQQLTKQPPKYEIDGTKANATLKRWRFGELKPRTHNEAQRMGAELLRSAVWFWNKTKNANARQVFAALHKQSEAPSNEARELIEAARQTFARMPTTARTIRNILGE